MWCRLEDRSLWFDLVLWLFTPCLSIVRIVHGGVGIVGGGANLLLISAIRFPSVSIRYLPTHIAEYESLVCWRNTEALNGEPFTR